MQFFPSGSIVDFLELEKNHTKKTARNFAKLILLAKIVNNLRNRELVSFFWQKYAFTKFISRLHNVKLLFSSL
jgi:hypothetical protein